MRISNLSLLGFLATISWGFSQKTAASYELETTNLQPQNNVAIPQWQDAAPVHSQTTSQWSGVSPQLAQHQPSWSAIASTPSQPSINPQSQPTGLTIIPSVRLRKIEPLLSRVRPSTEIASNQIINPQPTLVKSLDLKKSAIKSQYSQNYSQIPAKLTIGTNQTPRIETQSEDLVTSPTMLAIANPQLKVDQVLSVIEAKQAPPASNTHSNSQNLVPNHNPINQILGIVEPTNRNLWVTSENNQAQPQNTQPSSNYLAQAQPSELVIPATPPLYQPDQGEYEQIMEQLKTKETEQEEVPFGDTRRGSPAITIANPHAFGSDAWTVFLSGGYQADTRYSDDVVTDDGGLGIGVGMGDARKAVGLELSYTFASFGGSRDFGSGGFNAKLHRRLGETAAVAVGWNGFLNLGDDNDFEDSVYLTFTKIFKTRENISSPLSRIALTGGCGNGQFGSVGAIAADYNEFNCFGSAAVRIVEPVSLIAEWTSQDFGVGVSYAPFKSFPLVITPAVRDLFGNSDSEPRFVLGVGLGWKF